MDDPTPKVPEAMLEDIRKQLEKMPRITELLAQLLEHLELAGISEEEETEAIGWLHYAVKAPKIAQLIFDMTKLMSPDAIRIEYALWSYGPSSGTWN